MLAAFGIGVSKSGFAGISLVHVLAFIFLFGARDSTGVVLPMLIVGDLLAVIAFRQHARWEYIRRLLLPAITGIVIGWALMGRISDAAYKPVVGTIILFLTALQLLRLWQPHLYDKAPHQLWFAWLMGLLAGVTTMLANAAGPIMALFFIAVSLPKFELVGTSAWFFLIVNVFKVPFSAQLGLIHGMTLLFNLLLFPLIALGIFTGQRLMRIIPQSWFEALLLLFATIASVRMIFF